LWLRISSSSVEFTKLARIAQRGAGSFGWSGLFGLWDRGREERDWRETRDEGLVHLVGLVCLVYLVCFVHRTKETTQTRETKRTRETGASPRRLWRRPFLRAHESVTDRAFLAWRPSFEAGSTAAARGEWRSTASPYRLPVCRLCAYVLILRQLLPECRRNQSASRAYV